MVISLETQQIMAKIVFQEERTTKKLLILEKSEYWYPYKQIYLNW